MIFSCYILVFLQAQPHQLGMLEIYRNVLLREWSSAIIGRNWDLVLRSSVERTMDCSPVILRLGQDAVRSEILVRPAFFMGPHSDGLGPYS